MQKSNYGQRSNFGRSSFGGQGGNQNRNFKSFSKPKARFGGGSSIHFTKFICKAEPISESLPYMPENKFEDFNIAQALKANIIKKGYIDPTPIQDSAIPFILQGRDVIGIANTGTGKTAAFLIPLLNKIISNPREKVLIMVPTRELAIQINQEFFEFSRNMKIFSVCCVGGVSTYNQISSLRRNHNIVIGTPGRLKDLVNRKVINIASFSTIVLDEADRMLDMGFVNDMRLIMQSMPKSRQTLFFMATVTRELDKLIKEFQTNPQEVKVKTRETSKNVDQNIVRVGSGQDKLDSLHNLLIQKEFSKVLIFGRTKHGVERLCQTLVKKGFKAESIHGDKPQGKRQSALRMFRENQSQILVATDVAARGLDIPNVSHVINYDVPENYEDYVHRIGRTGRGNQVGIALTFIS
jgi:superfamily II DNA/RNA helicase